MRRRACLVLCAALAAAGCGGGDKLGGTLPTATESLRLTSPAFSEGGAIPKRHTCDGRSISPPLRWTGVPAAARELALVVVDPDAGGFVHWSLWHVSPGKGSLAAGLVPVGGLQGENSFGHTRYDGPCPPKGSDPHHYELTLYALSAPLGLKAGASPADVRKALGSKALARGRLVGTYGR